jgi:hypothetical protein
LVRGVQASSLPPLTAAARVETAFERCRHDANPEAIAALRWIIRRLRWEDQLAELHASAQFFANDS